MKHIHTDVLQRVSAYVTMLLKEKLPEQYYYHNLGHTDDVINNVAEIAQQYKLSGTELEIVLLAAWFHDTGYSLSRKEHEQKSVKIVKEFFTHHSYAEKNIKKIIGCIKATKVPQKPKNLLEEIVCDADLLYLGKKNMIERADMLRMEFEQNLKKTISETEWLQQTVDFLHQHHFHTSYAIKKYEPMRQKNLVKINHRLAELKERKD